MNADQPGAPVISEIILPLSSAEATLASAGGKGANLAALTRAGLEVPPGFIVTTDAYCTFVDANRMGPRLLDLAEAVSPDDPTALDTAAEEIRALFTCGIVPAEIAESIGAAYASFPLTDDGYPPVAVRSSATAEDLPGLSFAGQQDTYLNIVGPNALIEESNPAGAACGRRGPWATVRATRLPRTLWPWRWWCRRWSYLRSPASYSQRILSPGIEARR